MDNREEDNSIPVQMTEPPTPPPFQHKLQFYAVQLIGVFLLMVLPILALLGFFGANATTVHAANAQVAMEIEYASRFRYKMYSEMKVTVTNLTGQSPVTATVTFDRSYMDQFSEVVFTPPVARITEHAYEVELQDIEAGDIRVVLVELRGKQYWHHTGTITASLMEGEPVRQSVSTTVFP